MAFTHLQIQSGYSLMESTIKIDELINHAISLGFKSLVLTDYNVLHGSISFYKACKQNGIKPVLGLKTSILIDGETIDITLLAKNNIGYERLLEISTHIQLNEQITYEELISDLNELICLYELSKKQLEIIESNITKLIHDDTIQLSKKLNDNFYIVINDSIRLKADIIKPYLSHFKFEGVVSNRVLFLNSKDVYSYDCLISMKENKVWNDHEVDYSKASHYLKEIKTMKLDFSEWEKEFNKVGEIIENCNVIIDFSTQLLPTFPLENITAKEKLEQMCFANIELKYELVTDEVRARIKYELEVINDLNFNDYFLIVADLVHYAKRQGILVGPGRGSAAGSIVSYLLDITTIDPIKYNLLFERFLNPERATMPDIDIDFSDYRRDEVIDYVKEKYGQEHVAQIITFGTYAPRLLIRELMKTMDVDPRDQAYVLKKIPAKNTDHLISYLKKDEDFASYVKQSSKLKVLFKIAITLEGLPRHVSTHAAGIVLTDEKLVNNVPLMRGSEEIYLTQYAMNELEAIGLLKIDLLGLKNLTLIEQVVQSIKKTKNVTLDLEKINETDEKTFELLRSGQTNGIFQLESEGMKRNLKLLKPSTIDDITALNALYRPGPMEQIPLYIKRKINDEPIVYVHPDLEPILKTTYGVLVYQEQIMQIAHSIAGFTLGEADLLRRAVSKKESKIMYEIENKFIEGCLSNGYEILVAKKIFSWIIKFADYGFNKSHSVAYSKISYNLSFLKANYPTDFFAELLSTTANQPAKLMTYINEAKKIGIEVLPPSINKSYGRFSVEGKSIRMGLTVIKGIGYQTVQEIVKGRKRGTYTDLFDFCLKTSPGLIKRNILELLILAGTFDETYSNRASLIASINQAQSRAELFGGDTLLSTEMKMKPVYTDLEDFTLFQKLDAEKEYVGMYISNHPLKELRGKLNQEGFQSIKDLTHFVNNTSVKLVAIIQQIRKIRTKHGDSMAFLILVDEDGETNAVIFPKSYREFNKYINDGAIVTIEAKISERNKERQLIINNLMEFDLSKDNLKDSPRLFIKISSTSKENVINKINAVTRDQKGNIPIILYYEDTKETIQLNEHYANNGNKKLLSDLKSIFGKENVVLMI